MEQARLDNRIGGPTSNPLVHGDEVVARPEGRAYLHAAAYSDGAAAAGAADGKHRRYPAWALSGGRLVPFAVEIFGRWGKEALDWLREAVDAVAEVDLQIAIAGHWGESCAPQRLAHPSLRCSAEGERCLLTPGWAGSRRG